MASLENEERFVYDIPSIRTLIITFSVHLGRLFGAVEGYAHVSTVQNIIIELLDYMQQISSSLYINLEYAIIQKMHLNKLQSSKEIAYQLYRNCQETSASTDTSQDLDQSTICTDNADNHPGYEHNIHFMSRISNLSSYLKEYGRLGTARNGV